MATIDIECVDASAYEHYAICREEEQDRLDLRNGQLVMRRQRVITSCQVYRFTPGFIDRTMYQVAQFHPNAIRVTSVGQMVEEIRRRLGLGPTSQPRDTRIRTLRIYGHGAPGMVGLYNSRYADRFSRTEVISADPNNGNLLQRAALARLTGCFDPQQGSVELHACAAASGPLGQGFVNQLATLWQVPVNASSVNTPPDEFTGIYIAIPRPAPSTIAGRAAIGAATGAAGAPPRRR